MTTQPHDYADAPLPNVVWLLPHDDGTTIEYSDFDPLCVRYTRATMDKARVEALMDVLPDPYKYTHGNRIMVELKFDEIRLLREILKREVE